MKKITKENIKIPADVPLMAKTKYTKNFLEITKNTGKLMLFAGDQKIEHLNEDFYGNSDIGQISEDDNNPEHLFKIASKAEIGVFAAQYGLISLYGRDYPNIPYLVKLNSKTHLVKTEQEDPISRQLATIKQVLQLKRNAKLNILGVGYTIYIGSEHETKMLKEASNIIIEAHKHGLLTVLWIYPRGKAIKDEKCPHLIAGATGVAACLGADFVKVNYPKKEGESSAEIFKEAVKAAGRCKVVCAGGSSTDARKFLQQLHDQITISGAQGNATGRNIHQKNLDEAVRMCNAISSITLGGKDTDFAMEVYEGNKKFKL